MMAQLGMWIEDIKPGEIVIISYRIVSAIASPTAHQLSLFDLLLLLHSRCCLFFSASLSLLPYP